MSPLLLLILQVAVVLATARVVGALFRRIGQPQVVGEMVAGLVLGPSVLGWVAPGAFSTLFPADGLVGLNALSQIGLLVFMFLVGLEFDAARLKGRGDAAILTSHASIIIPFLLGTLLSLVLYPRLSDAAIPFTGFALFTGASMSVTAFPVLARILTERNLVETKLGSVAIACAAVDDVTAWSLLAIVIVIVRASAATTPLWVTIGGAVAYVGLMLTLGRRALRVFERYFLSRGRMTQDVVAGAVLLLLVSAWITERLGIHALFGAFLLGAVMPKHPRFVRELVDRLEDVTVVVLLPLFFAFTGLRTSIGLVQGPAGWTLFGLILLAATAGKLGGSALASRLTGLGWRESTAVGVLMNTRGLMELVIISIGLELGVISPELFAMMVMMALVTTFMTTPLLTRLYPERLLRAHRLGDEGALGTRAVDSASPTIVLPVSLPSAGPGLLRAALACSWPSAPRRVYAVHLIPAADDLLTDVPPAEPAPLDEVLAPLAESARAGAVPLTPVQFVSRNIGRDLVDVCEANSADLLVMGWHKPIVSRSVLGGIVHEVMSRAPCDVGVLLERGPVAWRRILVPFRHGVHDARAVAVARRIADAEDARLTVLIIESGDGTGAASTAPEMMGDPDASLVGELARLDDPHVRVLHLASPNPLDTLMEEARRGYDLIVLGVSAAWGTEPTMFGRRHEAVATASTASVLVVRAGARSPRTAPMRTSDPRSAIASADAR